MLKVNHFLHIFIFSLLHISPFILAQPLNGGGCRPIYVRWPRVRLNNQGGAKSPGPSVPFGNCQKACSEDKNPAIGGNANLQCSALNHRSGLGSSGHECQIFSREHVQHTDGYMEADDRYTFYWKFCVDTQRSCTGEYAFTFLSDRYMLKSEVSRTKFTKTLEDCLAECLNDSKILCRSVSFNRTDGGCHLSEQNQLSKPTSIRINNNPNYRIDYYENNCYNNSFKFTPICEPNGIRIRVESRIPYTGALYGLYDFFSCRIEPKEATNFDYLFPYPNLARNCSDSMRQSGDDIILEVVLSTDGVEPLYFITADDLTYQARCPVPKFTGSPHPREHYELTGQIGDEKRGPSINSILEALSSAAEPTNLQRRFGTTHLDEENSGTTATTPSTPKTTTNATSGGENSRWWSWTTLKPFTKDIFTLPLYTLGVLGGSEAETTGESEAKSSIASSTPAASNGPFECLERKENCEKASEGGKAHSPRINDSFGKEASKKDNEREKQEAKNTEKVSTSTLAETSSTSSTSSSTSSSTLSSTSTKESTQNGQETPKLRPTTIVVHQQRGSSNIPENEASDDSAASSSLSGRRAQNGNGQSGRPGMEPIFEDDEDSTTVAATSTTTSASTTSTSTLTSTSTASSSESTSSASSVFSSSINPSADEQVKTTTKRSTDGQTWDEGKKKFTFSTHLAFPTDRIVLRTGESHSTTAAEEANKSASTPNAASVESSKGNARENAESTSTSTTSSTTTSTTSTPEAPTTTGKQISPPGPNLANENGQQSSSVSSPEPPPSSTSSGQGVRSEFNPMAIFGSFGSRPGTSSSAQREKIIFDIYHNGQPAEAVVVGSRITLAFTPYFAIPPTHMSISGCQVEPIGSLYEWEKEPLAIIKEGCQADHVGLVCPPQKTDYGIRVTVEAFRYQTTTQVQYTCLLRVCPFAPCPQIQCAAVEGCAGDDIVSRTFGLSRAKRGNGGGNDFGGTSLAQPHHPFQGGLRGVWAALQQDERQHHPGGMALDEWTGPAGPNQVVHRMSTAVQQQLIQLGGDSLVRRRLIVVNSEDELRFYAKTGEVPQIRPGT